MTLSVFALVVLALLLAAWTIGAGWLVISARQQARHAQSGRKLARRLTRMIEEAPAIPLLVRADGRIEGPARLAGWLGLEHLPGYLSELSTSDAGLVPEDLANLAQAVQSTQKTARPFSMHVVPRGSGRSLALRGHLANPQSSAGGAAMIWVFDFSDSASDLARFQDEALNARRDFAALVGLIEAAPMPMWFRGPDGGLRLVNSAYVQAVGADDGAAVISSQIELVEPSAGQTAAEIALHAHEQGQPQERVVAVTIDGQRRTLRVSDLPLGEEGVAGYAVDIEEMEEQARELRAFRHAQRSMLDQLSIGVAQFDGQRQLAYTNQPFCRIFALAATAVAGPLDFDGFLAMARDGARVPEVRDFPAWRQGLGDWFLRDEPAEEAWPLRDGTHLRIVAQPMPDGGLVLVVEDRTEQLALSATRDTLLRTRTATFDSLFESLAVFAPDGRLQLWNRRFAADWGLEDEFLDAHPRVDALLRRIEGRLARPAEMRSVGDVVRAATLDRKHKDGQVRLADGRTLRFAGVPLPDGNGLLTVLDITDSEKAEAALRERNAALEEADAVKTRFLANMSYEFRTPLTSIGGFAELLQTGVAGELSEKAQEYVAAILESVARLGEQIETVLDLSQSEAGLLPLAQEDIELFSFLTRIVREREQALKHAGLSLDLKGGRSAGRIVADKRKLARAIGHLLDNAIAATPSGGRIAVELIRRGKTVRLTITDTGEGMDEKELAQALDGGRMTPDAQGVARRQGLGLPLARQLIEAHGGRLELASTKGQGTTAVIVLP